MINRGAVITEVNPNNEIVFELEIEAPSENNSSNVYCANKFNWFFDSSIIGCANDLACNYESNTIIINNDICVFPGDPCELNSGDIGLYNDLCECIEENTSIKEKEKSKNLIKIIDILGREKNKEKQSILLHIYDNGTVEKRYLIK